MAGPLPTPDDVQLATSLGAKAGTKVGLAWAMYCRPSGATREQVITVCGGPQLNKATDAARDGSVLFIKKGGLNGTVYFLRQPGVRRGGNELSSVESVQETRSNLVTQLVIPAARVNQGDLVLYATAIKVRDLVANGFYSVDTLDPDDQRDQGYQRLLNKSRAKRVADYLVQGQERQDAFLPTSVFLATDRHIDFDPSSNTISINTAIACPLSVVDGQHRLEGLRLAADKDPRVLNFELPVNIASDLSKIAQMCHFLIVNSTQKSVDKSVEQRIIGRLSDALELEDVPTLPRWILNVVERGEVERAVKLADYLNETEGSPWLGKIRMANDGDAASPTINQRSFVRSIVKYVLTANNPISVYPDFDKQKRIFLNYWKAIANVLDDGDSETLYKYGGVELFSKFSQPFLMKLQNAGNFTVATMESTLRSCLENIEGDYAGVGHPEWWKTGGHAGRLNSGALTIVAQEMTKALHRSASIDATDLKL